MEVGNIGSGNAANALARMINQRVDIDIPKVEMLKVQDFAGTWSKISNNLFLCWSHISGLTNATVLTIFKINEIIDIISLIIGEESKIEVDKIHKFNDFPELYQSALSEVGHILGSHYTNALGNLLNVRLMTDPPDVNIDSGKNLVKILKEDLGLVKELSLVITTQIILKEKKIQGSFLFIPDLDKLKALLDALSEFQIEI
ncbi:MAG: hypothetical protein EAX96_06855 [Candidatus Lokiarchaeota archaeon]|nr:hypothetical protein [Candidatus Lokiarchaeota archaeon]